MTRSELAVQSGLEVELIDYLELGVTNLATFDNCYRISSVLTRRTGRAWILQDLWCAARCQFRHE
ncbi:MAG: hypothetical protein ACKV2V_22635 [Blastocatellia bacterium]